MNYVKTIFITTIFLNVYTFCSEPIAYTQEAPIAAQESLQPINPDISSIDDQKPLIADEATVQEITKEEQPKEKTAFQQWSDHLDKLTAVKTEQWNASNNVPDDKWTSDAIDLAKAALDKDNSIAESLKSAFFDSISKKIDQEEGAKFTDKTFAVITEFNNAIEAEITKIKEAEAAKTAAKTIVLEDTKPEPVTEESVTTPEESISTEPAETPIETSTATDSTSQDLLKEWDNQLDKIKTIGTEYYETNDLFNNTYQVAHKLLLSGLRNEQALHNDFQDALDVRQFREKLYPINISDFDVAIGLMEPEGESSPQRNQTPAQQRAAQQQEKKMQEALAKLRNEMKAKEAKTKAERDKEALQVQAAIKLSQEQGRISEAKAHNLELSLASMKKKIIQDEVERKEQAKTARAELIEEIKNQMTTAQKGTAPKGIIGSAMEAVTAWWYGSDETKKPKKLSKEEQDTYLNAMANTQQNPQDQQAVKTNWLKFQQTLLAMTTDEFWNKNTMQPNNTWINTIKETLHALTITYHILPIADACDIVANALASSADIEPARRKEIIKDIRISLEQEDQKITREKQAKENAKLQLVQQKNDRKEQILLAQQRINDEKKRIEEDERKKIETLLSYKNQKNEWNQLLAQLSHNTQATAKENNAQMREALKKSESLLSLASNIPTKNKPAISQKLKQKFTVALLEQQKPNENKINIHQTMDQFNKEINKLDQ